MCTPFPPKKTRNEVITNWKIFEPAIKGWSNCSSETRKKVQDVIREIYQSVCIKHSRNIFHKIKWFPMIFTYHPTPSYRLQRGVTYFVWNTSKWGVRSHCGNAWIFTIVATVFGLAHIFDFFFSTFKPKAQVNRDASQSLHLCTYWRYLTGFFNLTGCCHVYIRFGKNFLPYLKNFMIILLNSYLKQVPFYSEYFNVFYALLKFFWVSVIKLLLKL